MFLSTSAKEVKFLSASICWFVGLSAQKLLNRFPGNVDG